MNVAYCDTRYRLAIFIIKLRKKAVSRRIKRMSFNSIRTLTMVALAASAVGAQAAPVTPTYTSFSNLSGATYGGTGIPTDPSAITTLGSITLGLAATQRGVGPNLGNNGAGTYFANPGSDGHGHALWNFDYYVNVATGSLSDYSFTLLYDFNPGVGTDESQLGVWHLLASGQTQQDSENLGFGFLSTTIFEPFIIPPTGTFDPNANGEYSFALIASSPTGVELGRSAINVDVGQVPEPATLALFGLGLFGFAAVRRKSSKGARA